jgi:energy-coupling factor transporter ATP-binding protein EcfA2
MPSLLEDLTLPLLNRGIAREDAGTEADTALRQVELAGLSNKSARQLSLGQRKRAAIAAALVCSPDLLILDEPTAELDGRARRELMTLLQSLPTTTFVASHDLDFLAQTVKLVVALENGKLRECIAMSEFIDDFAFQEQLHLR